LEFDVFPIPAKLKGMANAKTGCISLAGKEIIVALHTANVPSDEEWDEYLGFVEQALARVEGDASRVRGFAITDGGAPNAKHRGKLNAYLKDNRIHGSVVTSNPLVRGVVTALSWVNPNIRAFSPRNAENGLRQLGLANRDMEEFWNYVRMLAKSMPQIITLEAIEVELAHKQRASA
jgi:hypothetical protein